MTNASPLIALAAGGTGGHLFPAIAVADALIARGCKIILFTDGRTQNLQAHHPAIDVRVVASGTTTGRPFFAQINNIASACAGLFQCLRALRQTRPAVAVGFGGYPSLPPMIAASLLQIPLIIHEQNAVCGKANRLLASRARVIATGFPTCRHIPAHSTARIIHIGNPVRDSVVDAARTRQQRVPTGQKTIVVTGGSQGAAAFAHIVPVALAALPVDIRDNLTVWHQSSKASITKLQDTYRDIQVHAICSEFFENLPKLMSDADLVISRAGALTVTELAIVGTQAILVPLPTSADGHQAENAKIFESHGGGIALPQSALQNNELHQVLLEILRNTPDNEEKNKMPDITNITAARDFADLITRRSQEWTMGAVK